MSLGAFDNEREAGIAYNIEAIKVFGKFAHLNDLPCIKEKFDYKEKYPMILGEKTNNKKISLVFNSPKG